MNPGEVLEYVKKAPFEPFRLWMSDGSCHTVQHPDQIMVGRRVCYVGSDVGRDGEFQQVAKVAILHITRIEPFDPPSVKTA